MPGQGQFHRPGKSLLMGSTESCTLGHMRKGRSYVFHPFSASAESVAAEQEFMLQEFGTLRCDTFRSDLSLADLEWALP